MYLGILSWNNFGNVYTTREGFLRKNIVAVSLF